MISFDNKKVGFIIDSSSNVSDNTIDDVKVIPLGVTVDNKNYKDGIDFNFVQLKQALDANKAVKTSQANMNDMINVSKEMSSKFDIVFVFPIHSKLSSNFNTWKIIADDFPKLKIIMTYDIGCSFLWTITEVKEFLKAHNAISNDVEKFIETNILPKRVGWLMVNDLTQLARGGRVSGLKAAISNLLGMHPIILFNQNGLTNLATARNYDKYFTICDQYINDNYKDMKVKKAILFIPDVDESATNNFLNSWKMHYHNLPYEIHQFPTVVIAHTGINHIAQYIEFD